MSRLLILVILIGLVSCSKSGDRKDHSKHREKEGKIETYYTCSMHPQIKEKKPGKCPICYMNLTKVELEKGEIENNSSNETKKAGSIWICQNYPDVSSEVAGVCPMDGTEMIQKIDNEKASKVVASVKLRKSQLSHFTPAFFPATKMRMTKKIRLLGTVLQSEEKESNIPVKVGGRVEKVYVKSTGSLISKGEPVVDLYSPKLITAGEEYLIAKKSYEKTKTKEFQEMITQSEEKLKLWGVKSYQFNNWYNKGRVPKNITIYSESTGIVQKRNALNGKYFKQGQNFFELSDLSDVWIEMDVYEQDSNLIKIGQVVHLEFTALPGEIFRGEIDFINPTLDASSRTLKVRTTISNKRGRLRPGMVADATLNVNFNGMPLVVPRTAIIDTGKRKVVWLKKSENSFVAQTILAGLESEGYVEIKQGLKEGNEVVIDGNFLLDAQAQLFGGYENFNKGHN